jgi:alkenylglycerophosphocholine hydrolase
VTLPTILLAAAALIAAVLTIVADQMERWRLIYILRPLTLILIIGLAALGRPAAPSAYKYFILGGLGLSLAGDAFMMLRRKRFEIGLAAFLFAHLCYIAAFRTGMLPRFALQPLLPLVIFAALLLRTLLPYLGKLKYPVLLYVAIITAMAALAAGRFIQWGGTKPLCAFAGAALFLASDSVLAYNRFAKPIPRAQIIILGTYFAAQALIALSV